MKSHVRTPPSPGAVERAHSDTAFAEVETMIVRLSELRQQEPGKERKADFQAAINRLHALAYRLERDATPGRVIGLPPAKAEAPAVTPTSSEAPPVKVAPKPQPALPLGPVIVRARRPRR